MKVSQNRLVQQYLLYHDQVEPFHDWVKPHHEQNGFYLVNFPYLKCAMIKSLQNPGQSLWLARVRSSLAPCSSTSLIEAGASCFTSCSPPMTRRLLTHSNILTGVTRSHSVSQYHNISYLLLKFSSWVVILCLPAKSVWPLGWQVTPVLWHNLGLPLWCGRSRWGRAGRWSRRSRWSRLGRAGRRRAGGQPSGQAAAPGPGEVWRSVGSRRWGGRGRRARPGARRCGVRGGAGRLTAGVWKYTYQTLSVDNTKMENNFMWKCMYDYYLEHIDLVLVTLLN